MLVLQGEFLVGPLGLLRFEIEDVIITDEGALGVVADQTLIFSNLADQFMIKGWFNCETT